MLASFLSALVPPGAIMLLLWAKVHAAQLRRPDPCNDQRLGTLGIDRTMRSITIQNALFLYGDRTIPKGDRLGSRLHQAGQESGHRLERSV